MSFLQPALRKYSKLKAVIVKIQWLCAHFQTRMLRHEGLNYVGALICYINPDEIRNTNSIDAFVNKMINMDERNS